MEKIILSILACIIVVNCKTLPESTPLDPQADPVVVDDVAFYKLGTYRGFTDSGAEYQKSYFLSRYSTAAWAESKAICKAFDLELTSMETLAESRALLLMSESHSFVRTLGTTWFWTDGITLTGKSTTDWYWTKSGRKISFTIPWLAGSPDTIDQFCLVIGKNSINSIFGFNDAYCYTSFRFSNCNNFYKPDVSIPAIGQSSTITNFPAFIKLGTFRGWTDSGLEYQKSYFFPRFFKANWGDAKGLCSSFGLELTTLETRTEAESFINIVENHQTIKALGKVWMFIDGITLIGKSPTEWFSTKSGNKINFSLPWSPGQPDCFLNNEFCLSVGKRIDNQKFALNDSPCWDSVAPFICQRIDFMMS